MKLLNSANYGLTCIHYQKLFLKMVIFQYLVTDNWFRFHLKNYVWRLTLSWTDLNVHYIIPHVAQFGFKLVLYLWTKVKLSLQLLVRKKNLSLIFWPNFMTSVNTNIKQYLEAMMETVSSFQNQSNFTFTRNCGNIKKMLMLATYFFQCNERHFTSKTYVDIRMKI